MLKTIAVGASLASIYAAAVAPGAIGTVEATAPQRASQPDNVPVRASEPACPQTGWPHYDDVCIRGRPGLSEQPGETRQVRIVTVDRLSK